MYSNVTFNVYILYLANSFLKSSRLNLGHSGCGTVEQFSCSSFEYQLVV